MRYIRSSCLKEIRDMLNIWLIIAKDILFIIIEPFNYLPACYSFLLICMAQKDNDSFYQRIDPLYWAYSLMLLLQFLIFESRWGKIIEIFRVTE